MRVLCLTPLADDNFFLLARGREVIFRTTLLYATLLLCLFGLCYHISI